MMKYVLSAMLMFVMSTTTYSQDYNTGIGVRGGFASGLSVKHFIGNSAAVEGILSSRWRGFSITGLYELHNTAFSTERLNWYYGIGGHVGFWNGKNANWADDEDDYTVIGVDGILGIEYNFAEIPFNISADWKPAFNLVGYSGFWGDGGALSLRYIF